MARKIRSSDNAMSLLGYKPKTKPALWREAFPDQKAPAREPVKRVRQVSKRQAERLREYALVAMEFIAQCIICPVCGKLKTVTHPLHIHHIRGRAGELLCDKRWFLGVHDDCHRWIDSHRAEAQARGWLAKKGQWNTKPKDETEI